MGCDRRQQIRALAILLAGIVLYVFEAGAVQEPYDIELKELRRPPVRRTKDQRPPHESTKPVASVISDTKGEKSSYTVLPGEHLFLILMQRYGLSNRAAEQLIPEIMRLNNIRRPESLSVGQRLIIPLPPAISTATKSVRSPLPESVFSPPIHVSEKTMPPSQTCRLAREIAEQLGVGVSALFPFIDAKDISLSKDNLQTVTVCGLGTAETYTLKRLLARHKIKLLSFKTDETPHNLTKVFVGTLGISFNVFNTDAAVQLPLSYHFQSGIAGKDLNQTIRPDLPASK